MTDITRRLLGGIVAAATAAGGAGLLGARLNAQRTPVQNGAQTQNVQNVPTPRTADGHPDLTGLWVATPRPAPVDELGNITATGSSCKAGCPDSAIWSCRDATLACIGDHAFIMKARPQRQPPPTPTL